MERDNMLIYRTGNLFLECIYTTGQHGIFFQDGGNLFLEPVYRTGQHGYLYNGKPIPGTYL